MRKTICAVVPDISINEKWEVIKMLDKSEQVETIVVYTGMEFKTIGNKFRHLTKAGLSTVKNYRLLANECKHDYFLIFSDKSKLNLGQYCIERMISVAENTGAGIVYSDYHEVKDGVITNHPLIEYQEGSARVERWPSTIQTGVQIQEMLGLWGESCRLNIGNSICKTSLQIPQRPQLRRVLRAHLGGPQAVGGDQPLLDGAHPFLELS